MPYGQNALSLQVLGRPVVGMPLNMETKRGSSVNGVDARLIDVFFPPEFTFETAEQYF